MQRNTTTWHPSTSPLPALPWRWQVRVRPAFASRARLRLQVWNGHASASVGCSSRAELCQTAPHRSCCPWRLQHRQVLRIPRTRIHGVGSTPRRAAKIRVESSRTARMLHATCFPSLHRPIHVEIASWVGGGHASFVPRLRTCQPCQSHPSEPMDDSHPSRARPWVTPRRRIGTNDKYVHKDGMVDVPYHAKKEKGMHHPKQESLLHVIDMGTGTPSIDIGPRRPT
mmetsp:Transcript_5348/g.18907  ORF Transcript_5348/g.18907 Transcript_5348/m.18907 type:complete len:226 (+) Transcript_5348:1846-2523(+)